MNKLRCYDYLSKIKDTGVSITEHLERVVGDESVPLDTLVFIDSYFPLDSVQTYRDIHEKRYNNPLYKNLVNENSSSEDRAVALSSLMTRIMIRMTRMDEKRRKEYASEMHVREISDALNEYSYNKNSDKLNEVFNNTRSILKKLF